jgi:hypothetical protein
LEWTFIALSRASSQIFIARKRRGVTRLPSLRWHYPDQVNGFDLSRALFEGEGSTPWL